MSEGQECGVGLEGFEAFEPGDAMETYRLEREEI
jgi:translation initiation factor IF-2